MMKKMMAIMIALSMFLTAIPAFAAAGDQPSDWAKDEVNAAIEAGLVPSNLQSNYQKAITRGEFAQLLVQTMFANYENASYGSAHWTLEDFLKKVEIDTGFTDTDKDYIKVAFALGSVNGVSATKFSPNKLITRQEAATMLANTIHTQIGFSYKTDTSRYGYSDFAKIADWAKPAVMMMYSTDVMNGVGDKFDYSGKYTREQSIATLKRIYDRKRIYGIALRGNIVSYHPSDEISYVVTKDTVKVIFDETASADNSLLYTVAGEWRRYTETKEYEFHFDKAVIMYGFHNITKSRSVKPLINKTIAGKPVKIDYGYMTMSIFNKDSLMEFNMKNVTGYMSLVGGYSYGYPEVAVEPKEIK